jgi:acetylornithine deacetylase/succinyl-diaminopimelate desuccinylase-like protein
VNDVVALLQALIRCDTSNPPGNETPAALVLRAFLEARGVECRLLAKEPGRANLVARVRGGSGPTLAFLTHLDVVPAHEREWSVPPFGGELRDGAVWGRGAVDVKGQTAAVAGALARLREPPGDVLLVAAADEEVGDLSGGADWLVEEHADVVRADYVVAEGCGERFPLASGPLYTFAPVERASCSAEIVVEGRSGDASLPGAGENALVAARDVLGRLGGFEGERRIEPETELFLAAVGEDAHPGVDLLLPALTGMTVGVSGIEEPPEKNVVPPSVRIQVTCPLLPSQTKADAERQLRACVGDGVEIEVEEPHGGSRSPIDTPLHRAMAAFVEQAEPGARLVPTVGYGFTDAHWFRAAFGSVAYGWIPFRYTDPVENLGWKHAPDERMRVDDLAFQVESALFLARQLGAERA